MFKTIDITQICNYDGMCMLSDKNSDKHNHGWCYGEKFGCKECPLKNNVIQVEFNDDWIE